MKTKITVGLLLAALVVTLLYLGGVYILGLLVIGAIMGMWEYYGLLRLKNIKTMSGLGIAFGLIFIFLAYSERTAPNWRGSMGTVVTIYVFSILVIQFWQIVTHRMKYSMVDMAATVFGSLYIGAFMSFFVLLMNMSDAQFPHDRLQNRLVLFLPMFAAWGSDVGAYFVGSFFGRSRIFPDLSPKKTLEGCVGGMLFAMFGFCILSFFIKIPFFQALILGGVASVFGQVGDLSESAFKREVNVKDSGRIFAGHGGFLDRVDSFLFTLPVIYHYFLWFQPWKH
ncbi:MAG: phosphatidate cytidylyltransferase [bacterium]